MSVEAMTTQPAIDLMKWIEKHRKDFKPPVANKYLYDGQDFFVMVIAGPNARNDFHITKSEEFFYQLKGDITVRIREDGEIKDHLVREGETFFIPSNVPHSPQRGPGTLGIVVERRRPPGDRLAAGVPRRLLRIAGRSHPVLPRCRTSGVRLHDQPDHRPQPALRAHGLTGVRSCISTFDVEIQDLTPRPVWPFSSAARRRRALRRCV